VGVRDRDRARRSPRVGDDRDHDARRDDPARSRVLRARRTGRGYRYRFVRADRPEGHLRDVGPHHDHAQARLGAHRRGPRGSAPTVRSGCLRYGRQRGRARRTSLGRVPGARHLLLHHGRHRHRRRRDGRGEALARPAASGVRPHAHSPRSRRGSVRRRVPVPRRLLGRACIRACDRSSVGPVGGIARRKSGGLGARGPVPGAGSSA